MRSSVRNRKKKLIRLIWSTFGPSMRIKYLKRNSKLLSIMKLLHLIMKSRNSSISLSFKLMPKYLRTKIFSWTLWFNYKRKTKLWPSCSQTLRHSSKSCSYKYNKTTKQYRKNKPCTENMLSYNSKSTSFKRLAKIAKNDFIRWRTNQKYIKYHKSAWTWP